MGRGSGTLCPNRAVQQARGSVRTITITIMATTYRIPRQPWPRPSSQAAGAIGAQDADKLTLLGVLGRGTWGTVYRGQWRNLDVAVKTVLFSDRTDGKGSLPHERAIMEVRVCVCVCVCVSAFLCVQPGRGGGNHVSRPLGR